MDKILQLTYDEKNILNSVYGRQNFGVGYNPNTIEEILEPTPYEENFFTGKNFVSPNFFVQTLYKVKGILNPIKFNLAVQNMIRAKKNLRANFCNVGARTVKVIKPAASVKPEIIFRNFTQVDAEDIDEEFRKILEADMRRNADLRHDPLIRFAVYKTGDNEFAVLVTAAQIIADSFDSENFFGGLSELPAVVKQEKIPDKLPSENQEAVREYWGKILNNPPPTAQLPFAKKTVGAYRQKAYLTKIPADILSDLRGLAQSNRMMLTAILQSAWGFILQAFNNRRDCLFCQILSSGSNENFSLNVIPVRLTSDNNLTVEQLIKQQFRQLVVSQPYCHFDWEDLENLTGGRKKLFDHFLSFAEFKTNELNYTETPAEVRGKIISRNSWDAQGMKLGVYFRYSEKNLSVTFLYDERGFIFFGGSLLARLYKITLQQILTDRNAKFSEFSLNLTKRIKMLTDSNEISHEDAEKKIRDFLYQLPILQGRFEGTVELFAPHAKIITCFEGDRISGELLKENFIFVMSGKLARNVDTGDGWYNPIDIVGKNSFVNPANFLDKQRLMLSAEVLSEQAEFLTIPRTIMIEAIRKNPEVALSVMNYALAQMEKYQALWIQS